MGCTTTSRPQAFTLHIRCENCMKEQIRSVPVPDAEDAPTDIDEFLGSNLLASLTYKCPGCDCVVGQLFAVSVDKADVEVFAF